jgi:hypothetical protein
MFSWQSTSCRSNYSFWLPKATSLLFCNQLLLLNFHEQPLAIFTILTMCTKSEHRVIPLDVWKDETWWWSFIQISITLWPLRLWLVWCHYLTYSLSILSLIWFLHSHLAVTDKKISCWSIVNQPQFGVLNISKMENGFEVITQQLSNSEQLHWYLQMLADASR